MIRHLLASFAVPALLLVAAGGCRDTESPVARHDLRFAGTLRICSDSSRPPMQFRGRDGVLRGFEVDLLREIADELHLEPVWVETRRSELVGAVVARTCDVIASSLPVRWEDQGSIQEIEYLGVPISLLVRDAEEEPLALGLCGKPIGAFARTSEQELLATYGEACERSGRPPIDVVTVRSTLDALGRLRAGRIDGLLDELPLVAWYAQRQTDSFDDGGTLPDEQVDYAIGYGRGRTTLFWGIRSALQTLHSDGRFAELLHRWGLDRTGVQGLPLYS